MSKTAARKTCDLCGTPAARRYPVRVTSGKRTRVAMVGSSCARKFPRARTSDLIRAYSAHMSVPHGYATPPKQLHIDTFEELFPDAYGALWTNRAKYISFHKWKGYGILWYEGVLGEPKMAAWDPYLRRWSYPGSKGDDQFVNKLRKEWEDTFPKFDPWNQANDLGRPLSQGVIRSVDVEIQKIVQAINLLPFVRRTMYSCAGYGKHGIGVGRSPGHDPSGYVVIVYEPKDIEWRMFHGDLTEILPNSEPATRIFRKNNRLGTPVRQPVFTYRVKANGQAALARKWKKVASLVKDYAAKRDGAILAHGYATPPRELQMDEFIQEFKLKTTQVPPASIWHKGRLYKWKGYGVMWTPGSTSKGWGKLGGPMVSFWDPYKQKWSETVYIDPDTKEPLPPTPHSDPIPYKLAKEWLDTFRSWKFPPDISDADTARFGGGHTFQRNLAASTVQEWKETRRPHEKTKEGLCLDAYRMAGLSEREAFFHCMERTRWNKRMPPMNIPPMDFMVSVRGSTAYGDDIKVDVKAPSVEKACAEGRRILKVSRSTPVYVSHVATERLRRRRVSIADSMIRGYEPQDNKPIWEIDRAMAHMIDRVQCR